jgi:hypothetical protein
MKKSREVPIQKGKIIANPMTMREMPYNERVKERETELRELRHGKTLDLHTPKKGRK